MDQDGAPTPVFSSSYTVAAFISSPFWKRHDMRIRLALIYQASSNARRVGDSFSRWRGTHSTVYFACETVTNAADTLVLLEERPSPFAALVAFGANEIPKRSCVRGHSQISTYQGT